MSLLINPQALSSRYVPSRLPHRDEQLSRLYSLIREPLVGKTFLQVIQLIGPVGTGKTSSDFLVVQRLREEAPSLSHLYVNLRSLSEPSPWLIFSFISSQVGARLSRSISAGEAFLKLVKLLEKDDSKRYVITVDEADELTGVKSLKGGRVVYNLTRLPELGAKNVAAVVFIARRAEWCLGLAEEEKSTLGSVVIRYPPYTLEQLVDIITYRASEAFRGGALEEGVAEHVARATLDLFGGDVRAALDLLLYAGFIAESEGARRVGLKHVEKALAQVTGSGYISEETIRGLTRAERMVLAAALLSVEQLGQLSIPLALIEENFEALSRQLGERIPREERDEALQKLHDAGLLRFNGPLRVYVAAVGPLDPRESVPRLLARLGLRGVLAGVGSAGSAGAER
ncbi:MAG: hypothetical protein QXJ99_02930 [Thermofilum sp.]